MPITLATLAQATAQEVFDQVATHLLTQNAKSKNTVGACMYRGDGGLKCAAGCLIADDEYDPRFEGRSWYFLLMFTQIPKNHEHLIARLQHIHDHHVPSAWKDQLANVAARFGLDPAVLR